VDAGRTLRCGVEDEYMNEDCDSMVSAWQVLAEMSEKIVVTVLVVSVSFVCMLNIPSSACTLL
ncbi:hypothetical protein Tco_1542195, partial [Tanacetum coccineum]